MYVLEDEELRAEVIWLYHDVLAVGHGGRCYDLKSLESDNRITLILSNIRELDRKLFYKLVYLI